MVTDANGGVNVCGPSSAEAHEPLNRLGLNAFRDRAERSLLVEFLCRFRNPLLVILIVVSAISALTGVANLTVITVIVLTSVTLEVVARCA